MDNHRPKAAENRPERGNALAKGGQSAEQQAAASRTLSVESEQRGSIEHAKLEREREPTVNGIRLRSLGYVMAPMNMHTRTHSTKSLRRTYS